MNSKYLKVLIERVLYSNHNVRYGKNPDSIYLIGFNKNQFDDLEINLKDAIRALNKIYRIVNCNCKTFLEIVEEITGKKFKTNHIAWTALKEYQLFENNVLILREMSKSKINYDLPGVFHTLIKNLDDAHFNNVHPKSDLIFIDYAAFLEKKLEG